MRADLPKLKWSPEISERVDLKPSKDPNHNRSHVFPKKGKDNFDVDKACEQLRKQRNAIPITETMSDAAVRFWFYAGTDTAVNVDDAVDNASKVDLKKKPTLKKVEEAFRNRIAANRWDIAQPQVLIPLLPRLVSWDDTIRLALEHPQPYTVSAMLWALPTPKECGASEEVIKRGQARLCEFIDSKDSAGGNEVGAALQFVHYPSGVQRFFKECKGYTKRYAASYAGPLLTQLEDAKTAYKTAKSFKVPMTATRILALIDHFGYENADLLVDVCAKNNEELKRIMRLHTPHAVAGWLRLLKKAALVDFADHYLMHEGANAIEGLIKTVARRGQMRDRALEYLNRHVAEGRKELVQKLASDETKKIRDLIDAHVLADKEDSTPELPDADWPKWMTTLMKSPKPVPASLKKLMPSQLPTVRTADGAYRIPTKVLNALLANVATAQNPPASLKSAKASMHEEDAGPFAWLFFERWFAAKSKASVDGAWVLHLVEWLGSDAEAAALGGKLVSSKWGRTLRPKAMSALRRMETPSALMALSRVRGRYSKARSLLEEVRTKWGCSEEEFLDRIVPTCGLNDLHCLELDFGKRKPIAAVVPPARIVIVDRDSGDVFQKIPPRRKVDDNDLYAIAREKYKLLRKSLGTVAEEQIPRLEHAMVSDRRFTQDHWRGRLSLHPVLGPIVCTLVWKTKRDDDWVLFMPTHPDDTCIDTNYDEVQLGDEVALAHPADMTDAERNEWATLIADSEIVQPFDQLARLAFRIGSADVDKELTRIKSQKKTGYDLNQWMAQRGFYQGPQKDQKVPFYWSQLGEWKVEVTVDPLPPTWNWPPSGEHSVTGIRFKKGDKLISESEIPPVIYSERLRALFK